MTTPTHLSLRTGWGFCIFLLLLAFAMPACDPPPAAAPQPPNIVFIFSDDHAYQAISAYGGRLADIAPTPNIDRLATEGMLFQHCYVTNSICAPSRAVIQTGKHSHINGVLDNGNIFDGTQQTFPKILSAAGYETAMIGKWHLKSEPVGFNYFDVLPGQGHYYNPEFINKDGKYTEQGYVTDIITDKAIGWLKEQRSPDKPFMVMIQHKAPHREWEPGPDHLDRFANTDFPEPDNLFDTYEGRGTAAHDQDMSIEVTMRMEADLKMWQDTTTSPYKRTYGRMNASQRAAWDAAYDPVKAEIAAAGLSEEALVSWKYQRYMNDYLGSIASVDDNVGRVLDYLEESGLAENTVVMYASDQGFYLGEHGWFDKRFMYQESFKTPFLVRWPGVVEAGSVNEDLVSNLDFAQTFLDIAGVEQPADMQGLSLKPILADQKPNDWRESVYYHYYEFPGVHSVHRHEGVFDGRYKLMHFYALGEWELYDREKDPDEMNSVFADPEYAGIAKKLQVELNQLRTDYQVPENELYEVK